MKAMTKLLLIAGLIASVQIGCGDDDDNDRQNSTDPTNTDNNDGTDSDTNVGSTDDTDTSGGDTGTGSSIPECTTCLKADATTGLVDGTTNSWGINGAWFTYSDVTSGGNSTITGSVSANGGYCAQGDAAEVIDSEYGTYWGAGIGLNLCQVAEGGDADTTYNIGTCPTDLSSIIGFRMILTGDIGPNEFRVTFAETGRDESTYIPANASDIGTSVDYLFADSTITYLSTFPDDTHPVIDVANVQALQLQVSTAVGAASPYNFCVENIEPITQ